MTKYTLPKLKNYQEYSLTKWQEEDQKIRMAVRYSEKTGKCPICRQRQKAAGVTCGELECVAAWVSGKPEPCAGLLPYGIQDWDCDLVAHVCASSGELFVYRLADGVAAAKTGKHKKTAAYQEISGEKVKTAGGFLVPPEQIPATRATIPHALLKTHPISKKQDTSTKGRNAQLIVQGCLSAGVFPVQFLSVEVFDTDSQIKGNDLVISASAGKIQVKCDLPGGTREKGGSGYLFLQTCEINPEKAH